MKNSRKGRPKLDKSELLRRRIWCEYVISNSGMTPYEMDIKFDIKLGNRTSEAIGSSKRRRKIFSELLNKNIMPFRKDEDRLQFLKEVEKHENLKGTAKLYNSFLWSFLSHKPLNPNELRELIISIVNYYDGFKLKSYQTTSTEISGIFSSRFMDLSFLEPYILNLQDVAALITHPFDKLALFGALFREAYYGADMDTAIYLSGIYINQLYETLDSTLISDSVREEFEQLCLERQYVHSYEVNNTYEQLLVGKAKKTPAYNLLIEPL